MKVVFTYIIFSILALASAVSVTSGFLPFPWPSICLLKLFLIKKKLMLMDFVSENTWTQDSRAVADRGGRDGCLLRWDVVLNFWEVT